jgi:large subunit ribosomal protein L22
MPGLKTNERPGTRAVLRHCRMSATKARVVLDLVRGQDVDRASEILRDTPREAADIIGKLLASAVANAVHNDGEDAEDLYVSACYADEGVTLKRWRPRARGRATRIRKRSCHITVIVSRMPEERLQRRRAERQAAGAQRQRRVAESRRRADLAGRLSRRRHAAEAEAALAAESPEVQFEEDDETSSAPSARAEARAEAEARGDAGETDAEETDAEETDAVTEAETGEVVEDAAEEAADGADGAAAESEKGE